MAGTRQPIDLLVAKGKKHLTKREIENRKSTEVTAGHDKVRAPTYLPKELKREFNKLAKDLLSVGIITNLDVDALARFVIAREMYNKLTNSFLKDPGLLADKDLLNNQDKLFKQCRAAASDLGLTISSRCKLVLPKPKEEKPQNKFLKFAGQSGDG